MFFNKRKRQKKKSKPLPPFLYHRQKGKSDDTGMSLKGVVSKAYGYSEINRIREKVLSALQENNKKTILIVSPDDGMGNTFLVAVLGYSIAYFNSLRVLLVDLNMRRPQLHLPFGLEMEKGFTDIAAESINWKEAIKPTGLMELKILTAGRSDESLSFFLNRPILKTMIHEMEKDYDIVIFDSSPLLNQNRNNCDPVQLSHICDLVMLVVKDKITTKGQLKASIDVVIRGGGTIDGIIYNHHI